jgi:predicted RNase H-like nuclease (RuvC/YqgF family)
MSDSTPDKRPTADPLAGQSPPEHERIRILERHCDHLMGQLYHQVKIIQGLREQAAHLGQELDAVRDAPKLLDEALTRVSLLKEELVGRKEVELDLRKRIAELELEEREKTRHIEKLERYISRVWNSPQGRIVRSLKGFAAKLLGRPVTPQEFEQKN